MSRKNYRIVPPPKERGKEPLFRVIYTIDVGAADARKAAETAWQMMRADDALAAVLTVMNSKGKKTRLDLSQYVEFNKVTTGFVIQRYSKGKSGKFRCTSQEFIAGDDVQFETNKGEKIETPQHDYQPFNMTILNTQQIIDRLADVLTSIDVGGEQSRQFAGEIKILDELLKTIGRSRD
ncbi:MAG: hypothetical protein PHF37_01890 [Phycisphaerae bacterium]|nr:hypothetical protein [Phycisphaerae bacterium]